MSLETLIKDPSDELIYTFTLADFLGDGETISSAAITGDPSGLTIGSVTLSDSTATALISGGTAGETYEVTCEATLSTGETLNRRGFLKVRDL